MTLPDVAADDTPEALRVALAQAQASQADLMRAISHDLRAPLRHLIAFGGLLREELGPAATPETQRYLDVIGSAAQDLAHMIDALLAFSRLARQPLQRAAFPGEQPLSEARAALAAQIHGRDIEWHIASAWPMFTGDAALLRELWRLLLDNALKFTRPRTPACIDIGWTREADRLTCWVRDNGVGFDPARAGHLFGLFQRLHSRAQFDGLGAGLAQARSIVERHGGHITLDAMPDSGCTVRFDLPAA